MKRMIPVLAVALGWATAACAVDSPLTTLRAVHAIGNASASHLLPVAFEATVTYYRNADTDLFVQDGGAAIYVSFKPGANLAAGDRVLVTGTTQDSFRPIVNAATVAVLRHGAAPEPLEPSFEELVSARVDCTRVKLRAQVRSANLADSGPLRSIYLQVLMDGGPVDVAVNSADPGALARLLDAEVEIVGVATAKFDQKMQLNGSRIDVQSLEDIRILKPAAVSADAIPVSPLDNILGGYRVHDDSRRVRVQGTITYYQPGSTVVLQNGSHSLWVMTQTDLPLRIGDRAEVTGFPDVRNGYSTLAQATVLDTHVYEPIAPVAVGWRDLGFGGNAFNLVSTEGRVVRQVREAATDEYLLESGGHVFSAIYRHPPWSDWAHAAAMKEFPVGARIHVTGIGMFYTPDPFNGPKASDILLRSQDDVVLVAGPPWLSVRHLLFLAGALFALILVAGARGWSLERKLRRQTDMLAARTEAEAAAERRRSRILEAINGEVPLAAILEQIAELASFQLDGVPCWCELAEGSRLGTPPPADQPFRAIQCALMAHTEVSQGTLFAAFDPALPTRDGENLPLQQAAHLAVLAIETRRLYSDLVHRSEFDLLTGIHNRFSLESQLDARIEEARQTARSFGLIYIDLDGFKRLNDLYGHHVGDLYLQEVAERMKRQLRGQDMLARLGGDEFAALIPMVRNRAAVEEIALRMERSFDEPLPIDGLSLRGGASLGIALYPEDGVTREELLSAADAAMYKIKLPKREAAGGAEASPVSGS